MITDQNAMVLASAIFGSHHGVRAPWHFAMKISVMCTGTVPRRGRGGTGKYDTDGASRAQV